jgi:hypothetical protein
VIVLEEAASLCLVTQHDHARLAHDILALWTADGLPTHPLREDLLLAVAEHDNGWREVDSAPLLRVDTGWPCDFRDYPAAERQRVWRLAVDRLASREPHVAYLVLLHAYRLHQSRLTSPEWQAFFGLLQEYRHALEPRLQADVRSLQTAYEYLWLADTLSLGACGVWGRRELTWGDHEISVGHGQIEISPFPFAGSFTLRIQHRLVPKRPYTGDGDLGAELAAARWLSFPVSVENKTGT